MDWTETVWFASRTQMGTARGLDSRKYRRSRRRFLTCRSIVQHIFSFHTSGQDKPWKNSNKLGAELPTKWFSHSRKQWIEARDLQVVVSRRVYGFFLVFFQVVVAGCCALTIWSTTLRIYTHKMDDEDKEGGKNEYDRLQRRSTSGDVGLRCIWYTGYIFIYIYIYSHEKKHKYIIPGPR